MKLFKSSLIALALAGATCANAATIAITNAKVHTVAEQGILENATVVIENGLISAINPASVSADETIDAQGKILTPGLISSLNSLGLVEVGAVSRSRDASDKKADMIFDASLAFNPKTTVIPYTRKGGITTDVVAPGGGDDMFKGQTFVVNLSGEFDSVDKAQQSLIIELGAKSKGSRALELQALTHKLEDAQEAKAKANDKKDDKDAKTLKRDEKIMQAIVSGEKQLVAYVDRATDILALLALKERFNLDLAIAGADDAVVVAEQIAKASVPVILSATSNLPQSFDTLHASLENAGKLTKAGVKVVLTVNGDTHNMYQLRFNAGIAVANGLPYEEALAAITANPAQVFDINAGQIVVGKEADLVLWTADPFELSSKVEKMWIDGKEYDTRSRQDELRDRYMAESDMPRAYIK
jgi:imidazolonepropionase-like amidohydrolase